MRTHGSPTLLGLLFSLMFSLVFTLFIPIFSQTAAAESPMTAAPSALDPQCQPGTLNCPCRAGATCDEALQCNATQVCVKPLAAACEIGAIGCPCKDSFPYCDGEAYCQISTETCQPWVEQQNGGGH